MDDEIRQRFEALEKRVDALEMKNSELKSHNNASVNKNQSLREFFNDFEPKSNNDKVLAIGYFKETIQGINPFSVKDVVNGFSDAKEHAPDNINLPIFYNAKKGFFMEKEVVGSKFKNWELTKTGIEEVKKRLTRNKPPTHEAKDSTKNTGRCNK